jgi:hypothetical protein
MSLDSKHTLITKSPMLLQSFPVFAVVSRLWKGAKTKTRKFYSASSTILIKQIMQTRFTKLLLQDLLFIKKDVTV